MDLARPPHRRSVSTPAPFRTQDQVYATNAVTPSSLADDSSSSSSSFTMVDKPIRSRRNASRFMTTVRRSFSPSSLPKKKHIEHDFARTGMSSTPQERRTSPLPAYRPRDSTASRPTIEQIAMGLHVSRTPHLRAYPYPQRHTSSQQLPPRTPRVYPPPPSRSSMKKPSVTQSTLGSSASSPALGVGITLPFEGSSTSSTTITESVDMLRVGVLAGRAKEKGREPHPLGLIKSRMARLLPSLPNKSTQTQVVSEVEEKTIRKAVRFSVDEHE